MRTLRILLVLAGAAVTALAQTNTSANVRQLSLQDCIQLALQHNLDLQIDRYGPLASLYGLQGIYGAYDPTLTLSGEHDHNESGSQLVTGGLIIPGSVSDSDRFGGGLSGLLPWGLTYNLSAGSSDTYGSNPSFLPDPTRPLFYQTNTVYDVRTGQPISTVTTNFDTRLGRSPFEISTASAGMITVSQPLLKNFWIDSTRLNIRVAKNRLKYSELTLKLQIMQTITTLEQAYYDLIYNRENVVVQQKALELAERTVVESKKKVEVGTLAPLDLQSAEAQAEATRAALIAAKASWGTQQRLVKQLITDKYLEWAATVLEPSGQLTAPRPILNLQDSWGRGLGQRPDLLQAKLDVEKAGIQLKFDHNQLFPELDVSGSYGYNGSGKEFSGALYDLQQADRPFYSFGGKLTLPLSRTSARNAYKADKATLQQVVLTLKKLEETIMIQIDNDIGTVRANFDQVQATRAAREYQEAALDAEQKKLESGKSTTYNVLLVQRDLTAARGSEIQALDTYNKSLVQLSLDEGSTLERLGITLQVVK